MITTIQETIAAAVLFGTHVCGPIVNIQGSVSSNSISGYLSHFGDLVSYLLDYDWYREAVLERLTIVIDDDQPRFDEGPSSPHNESGCSKFTFSDSESDSEYSLEEDSMSWRHPPPDPDLERLKLLKSYGFPESLSFQSSEASLFDKMMTGRWDPSDPMLELGEAEEPALIACAERILLLVANVYQCTTVAHMMTTVAAYVSAVVDDKSLILAICTKIDGIMGGMSEQATIPSLREVWDTWCTVANSELVGKIKKVIAVLASAGICSMASIKFMPESFDKVWDSGTFSAIRSSNILSHVIEAFFCVYERGLRAYQSGSVWDLFSDASVKEFDEKFALLVAHESLYYTGNLDDSQAVKSNGAYDLMLSEAVASLKVFRDKETNPFTKNVLEVKYQRLVQIVSNIASHNNADTIREAPFAILLCGPSSVGKSTVTAEVSNMLLRRKHGIAKPSQVVSLNGDDKFCSEYKPEHDMVIIDDINNTSPDFVEKPHTRTLVDFINNIPVKALKADVTQKGKVSIRPSFLIATANQKDLNAELYSTCPISILRRFNAIVEVKVKPSHQLRGTGMLDPDTMGLPGTNDAWIFNVQRAIPSTDTARRQGSVEFENIPGLHNIGFHRLLTYLGDASVAHGIRQASLVAGTRAIYNNGLCPHGSYAAICPECTPPPQPTLHEQGADEFFALLAVRTAWWRAGRFKRVPGSRWLFRKIGLWYLQKYFSGNFFSMLFCVLVVVFFMALYSYFRIFGLKLMLAPLFVILYAYLVTQDMVYIGVSEYVDRTPINTMAERSYVSWRKAMVGLCAFATFLYGVRRMLKATGALDQQGGAHSLPKPDAVVKDNPWVQAHIMTQEFNVDVARATSAQIFGVVKKKLAYSRITYNDGNTCGVCLFPIESNLWYIPYHIVRKGVSKVEVLYTDGRGISQNSVINVNEGSWQRIGSGDVALICLPNAGSQRNMTKWLPITGAVGAFSAHIISRNADLEFDEGDIRAVPGVHVMDCGGEYASLTYNCPYPTRGGMCMSPIISNGRSKAIVGFHVMGATGASPGQANQITLADHCVAKDLLMAKSVMNVPVASYEELVIQCDEYEIELTGTLHYKSPFKYIETPGSACLFGSHTGRRRTSRSKVIPSIISDAVTQIMGVPRLHGAPEHISDYHPWRIDALGMTQIVDIPLQHLEPAICDFSDRVLSVAVKYISEVEEICPLPHEAVLSGVDGVVGVDRIDLSTSAGWPYLKGKMSFVEIGSVEYPGITEVVVPTPYMMERIEAVRKTCATSCRPFLPFRVSLKDEATKFGKIKVRTIAGCNMEMLYLVRQYYLPIVKWVRDHNLELECAIGIVAQGPEWDSLAYWMSEYSPNHMVAGDYAAFDTSMAMRATLAVFNVMIRIAMLAGYTPEAIRIMWALATEICEPMYEFNGEFCMFRGTNPSGHPLTIFVNNWVNCIYMRSAYYKIYSNNPPVKFHQGVRLVTYGDDNASSVAPTVRMFNHTAIRDALASFGIVYTMADKLAESVPFIPLSEVTFLKRSFVKDEGTGCYFAPLEEASLFKMLHNTSGSPQLTLEELAVESIKNFYQEAFWHGKEYYDLRRPQLLAVAEECDLETYLPDSTIPNYEDYRETMMLRYAAYLGTDKVQ